MSIPISVVLIIAIGLLVFRTCAAAKALNVVSVPIVSPCIAIATTDRERVFWSTRSTIYSAPRSFWLSGSKRNDAAGDTVLVAQSEIRDLTVRRDGTLLWASASGIESADRAGGRQRADYTSACGATRLFDDLGSADGDYSFLGWPIGSEARSCAKSDLNVFDQKLVPRCGQNARGATFAIVNVGVPSVPALQCGYLDIQPVGAVPFHFSPKGRSDAPDLFVWPVDGRLVNMATRKHDALYGDGRIRLALAPRHKRVLVLFEERGPISDVVYWTPEDGGVVVGSLPGRVTAAATDEGQDGEGGVFACTSDSSLLRFPL